MQNDVSYVGIKDFNQMYPPTEDPYANENLGAYTSSENKITHLSKIKSIFDPSEQKDILETIRKSKKFYPSDFKGGGRDFYIASSLQTFEVSFDENEKIKKEIITTRIYQNQNREIRRIMKTAIERLGKELNWKNSTHHIACNAIDYHFTKDSEEPLDWHSDGFNLATSHSFVILLSDPNDQESGWTGGDFLYTGRREFDKEDTELSRLSIKTKNGVVNDPKFPIWSLTPSLNDGILFGNRGMNHKITAMTPLKEQGRRMILTIFAFPEPIL